MNWSLKRKGAGGRHSRCDDRGSLGYGRTIEHATSCPQDTGSLRRRNAPCELTDIRQFTVPQRYDFHGSALRFVLTEHGRKLYRTMCSILVRRGSFCASIV